MFVGCRILFYGNYILSFHFPGKESVICDVKSESFSSREQNTVAACARAKLNNTNNNTKAMASPAMMETKMQPILPLNLVFMAILFSVSLLSIYQQEQLLQHDELQPALRSTDQAHKSPDRRHAPTKVANQHHRRISLENTQSSSSILLNEALKPRPIPDLQIDHNLESERCSRYGLTYIPGTPRRKIYWGASIADDTWHILSTQAIEMHGLFDTAAFVESNRTSMGNPRQLRFDEGSSYKKRLQTMFGSDTRVSVDYYINEDEGPDQLVSLEREHAQRALILERWKQNGMTVNDIGYLSDTDELFSRDFLRAMQICNVPQFTSEGKDGHQNCAQPKVYGLVAIFEGSPDCVSAEEIYHPALMIGECIEGIGDSNLHPSPARNNNRSYSWRTNEWTFHSYYLALHDANNAPPPKSLPSNVRFPLFNAADFRRTPGGFFYGNDNVPLYVGYHVHNFFDDVNVMRLKYKTYGHAQTDALTKPLGDLNREVNLMVRCAMDSGDDNAMDGSVMSKYRTKDERRKHAILRRKGGLDFLTEANYGHGAVPIAFRMEKYVQARHYEMVAMIRADEEKRLLAAAGV